MYSIFHKKKAFYRCAITIIGSDENLNYDLCLTGKVFGKTGQPRSDHYILKYYFLDTPTFLWR